MDAATRRAYQAKADAGDKFAKAVLEEADNPTPVNQSDGTFRDLRNNPYLHRGKPNLGRPVPMVPFEGWYD